MVFERGRGCNRRRELKWGKEEIEEVNQGNKILKIHIKKNGGEEKHIQEKLRKAIIAMKKKTWSKRKGYSKDIQENFERRLKMFDTLVGSVALYGVAI